MDGALIAHVDYVTDPEGSPDPIGFVLDALGQPGSLFLLGLGPGCPPVDDLLRAAFPRGPGARAATEPAPLGERLRRV